MAIYAFNNNNNIKNGYVRPLEKYKENAICTKKYIYLYKSNLKNIGKVLNNPCMFYVIYNTKLK